MSDDSLVSVVMATYNGHLYIEEQIESILSQLYKNIELIIIDDNSSDDTWDIINNYSQIDSRIKVFRNSKNLGCSDSFSKGIILAKGRYIALCDQDDIWKNDKLSVMVAEMPGNICVYSNCEVINKYGKIIEVDYSKENSLVGYDSSDDNFQLITLFNSFILGCSILFSKEALEKIMPIIDTSHNHDKWLVFRLSEIGNVHYIDKVLFSYRIHGENLSIKKRSSTTLSIIRKFRKSTIPIAFDLSHDFKGLNASLINLLCFKTFWDRLWTIKNYGKYLYLRDKGIRRLLLILNWLVRGC